MESDNAQLTVFLVGELHHHLSSAMKGNKSQFLPEGSSALCMRPELGHRICGSLEGRREEKTKYSSHKSIWATAKRSS